MAMTVNDIMDTQRTRHSDVDVSRFPDRAEFNRRRGGVDYAQQNTQYGQNYDEMQRNDFSNTMSAQQYQEQYRAPQTNYYDAQYNNQFAQMSRDVYQEYLSDHAQINNRAQNANFNAMYTQPTTYTQNQPMYNSYAPTAQNNDLYAGQMNQGSIDTSGPVFKNETETAVKKESLVKRFFHAGATKTEEGQEQQSRARLNVKGMVIVGLYVALIILVAVLIIVNATSINAGTAVTPSSSAEIVETVGSTIETFSSTMSETFTDAMNSTLLM